ncbi:MAG: AraC family transcriptional regulator [Deltaproteobacteria bacterium]
MDKQELIKEYRSRINRTLDYIDSKPELHFTLEELAGTANFSRFHFNRIFQSMIGETPFQYINRIRIEKAATMLLMQKNITIKEIAFKYGFSDISVFSRYFKNHFNISASEYRRQKSKISQQQSNNVKQVYKTSSYFCHNSLTIKWKTNMKTNKSVEVKSLPEMTLAYIRHIGPYKGDGKLFEMLWNKLFRWAGPRGLIGGPGFKSLIVYHDDPNITEEAKLRMSVSVTVPADTQVSGEIGKMVLEAAEYVIARFELAEDEFQEAWDWVFGHWFPQSGYQPDDKPCFEMYPEEPKDGKFVVDVCVPVKPM